MIGSGGFRGSQNPYSLMPRELSSASSCICNIRPKTPSVNFEIKPCVAFLAICEPLNEYVISHQCLEERYGKLL